MSRKITLTSNIKHLKNTTGIYMMKFPNGKTYIGQSVDIYNRIKQHNWASKGEGKSQTKLFNALNKYGIDNIELIVLWKRKRNKDKEMQFKREMDKLEVEYIKEYNCIENGYNVQIGGHYVYNELIPTAENRKQKSERMKEYWRKKQSKPSIDERFNLIYEYGLERAAELCGMSEDNLLESITYKDNSKALSSHPRAQNPPLNKSKENPEVMELVTKHYEYLRKCLVFEDFDEDIFGDCILNMTYRYNPEIDFTVQFKTHFRSLKESQRLNKKLVDANIKNIDDYENYL